MTKHEILHALETLDRLDQEHSDKFGRRSSYGGSSYGNSTNNVPASSSTATASTQTQHSGMSPSPSNSYDTSPQPCTTNQNGRENNERLSTSNGKMSPTRYHANSMGQRSYSFEASEEDLDVDDKVEELMRRDSSVIKEEIKAFLANRRISQAVVAQVTGISQSRISHWLLQQGSDLSEQKKRAFYRWYQLEKTNPGATLSMRPAPIPIEDPEWRQTPPPVSATSGTFRLRRGSRFTWRKECLAVMESDSSTVVNVGNLFLESQVGETEVNELIIRIKHPSYMRLTEKEDESLPIDMVLQTLLAFAVTCYGIVHIAGEFKDMDATSELKSHVSLAPEEGAYCFTASYPTVPGTAGTSHYFNENQYPDEAKREEIANACNAVIQKPGKKLSDLERVTSLKVYNWFANRRKEIKRRANIEAAILESHGIDVQSPGGHSNSDDVDGNDYSEQDDSTSHSDHQDPISLAVEMAAVNHTILALARQGANEIKTEALDDD
ncbi:hypothetical protein JEQ12_009333 [Ovis aries]|uniref:Homeobox-containing protein 1 n=7 Tax=Amniota TaxID=32524 RepID=A0A836D906_SHEEP|nr:hypothetical protein JEQ12_009333 [Ovis aries]